VRRGAVRRVVVAVLVLCVPVTACSVVVTSRLASAGPATSWTYSQESSTTSTEPPTTTSTSTTTTTPGDTVTVNECFLAGRYFGLVPEPPAGISGDRIGAVGEVLSDPVGRTGARDCSVGFGLGYMSAGLTQLAVRQEGQSSALLDKLDDQGDEQSTQMSVLTSAVEESSGGPYPALWDSPPDWAIALVGLLSFSLGLLMMRGGLRG